MPVPQISNLVPNSGDVIGGEEITINGNNFTGVTAVTFGAVVAANFTVVANNEITVFVPVVPGLVTGIVNVSVTNSIGTSVISGADQFTYTPPTTSDLLNAITALGVQVAANASLLAGLTASVDQLSQLLAPEPITITSLSPTSGPGGTSVVITGTGFAAATQVYFGEVGQNPVIFTIDSDTQITARAEPPSPPPVAVDVFVSSARSSAVTPVDQYAFHS